MTTRTKHPKCSACGGCLDHSECRIIKKGGCHCGETALPPDLDTEFRKVLDLPADVPIVVK